MKRVLLGLLVMLLTGFPLAAAQDGGAPMKVLSTQRARMLPVSTATATEALAAVLEDLGFRLRVQQPEDGLLVTKQAGIGRLQKHGLKVSPIRGVRPFEVEVHAFVSRALEPAHVHVDAIVTSYPHNGVTSYGYSLGEVEAQILDALEKWLGVAGRPIPDSLEDRRAMAATLRPGLDPCAVGEARLPQVLEKSKVRPIFPAAPLREGETGRVTVLARLLSDGTTIPFRVLSGSGTGNSADMEQAALSAVGLWRYRPARNGTCPVDMPFTVFVDFTISWR